MSIEVLSVIAVLLMAGVAIVATLSVRARLSSLRNELLQTLNASLNDQGDRLANRQADSTERLRGALLQSFTETQLQLANLRVEIIEKTLAKLAENSRADQELIQNTLRGMTQTMDGRLEQISGKVSERLDEGFKKTNETFVNVMQRLATIDEAQKKIDGLTTNVVSLQQLLGDKRSRGAFGEVQLEALVRNMMAPDTFGFQVTLSNGMRADCMLHLPEPTGSIAVDSKFPLENYHRMFNPEIQENERVEGRKQFRADIRKHVDDIASRYIIPGETSEGAVMFLPAEAVFAEIHAYHGEIVDYAMNKRVWIVSPTTLMAVLNTARAVMKDVETRAQIHIIKDALTRLSRDFGLFDERMKKLADHIRLANKDVEEVQISSRKISDRFAKIESVQLEEPPREPLVLIKTDKTTG